MSKSKRPPEILRKSHAHSEGDRRARGKSKLRDELDEAQFALENEDENGADEVDQDETGSHGGQR